MGTFMKYLDIAKENPNIKKFVINIALNAGGESGISTAMADLNFDGVFDEKDDEVSYPFEFAVMVGAQTYSAANYLASMAKDNGIPVLGEQTGGGACSPQITPEPEGLYYSLSGRYSLMDKNNKNVDMGIEPDFVLTKEKDGEYDYSLYADFDEISRMIDEYYGKSN